MATAQISRTWQVTLRGPVPVAAPRQLQYGAIVASYGGRLSECGARFRRYRAAEACANSVRRELGVEADVELTADRS